MDQRNPQYNGLRPSFDDGAVDDEEENFKSLTREEAQALRARLPQISPWRVVAAQALAGLVMAAVFWLLVGRAGVVWSALYGAAIVLVQAMLMVRGLSRLSRSGVNASVGSFNFMLWEFLKVVVAVLMLAAATKLVPDLSWLAMLVTMVVCMKMNWLALLWQGRVTTTRS